MARAVHERIRACSTTTLALDPPPSSVAAPPSSSPRMRMRVRGGRRGLCLAVSALERTKGRAVYTYLRAIAMASGT